MKYTRTPTLLKIILAVSFFGLSPIVATAGSISIPTEWARVMDAIQLYDANYAKTVCPKCRAKAEDVARKAERLRRYLEAIGHRSTDFPDMARIRQTRRDQARFKQELNQKLAELAAVKKQFKALMADIKQIQLDTDDLVGVEGQTESPKTGVATQVVNTGRYFIESALRLTEYFVNGKPANSLTEDKNGESSLENIGKNIKDVNAFTALSKNGQALKLYAKAMRLEKAIRQLQVLIKITRENDVTPAEFRQLDSLNNAFERALAEQARCEKKYEKQCKKADDSTVNTTGSTIDWSEFGLVDRSAIDIEDLIADPMPGLIPDAAVDPLESTTGLLPDNFSFQKSAEQETQSIEPETDDTDGVTPPPSGDNLNDPDTSDKTPVYDNFDLGAPQSQYTIPRPTAPPLTPETIKKLEAIQKAHRNISKTKFRAVCETVARICERYRDGPARKKCLASTDLAQEVASCRAVQAGKTCTTRCNSVKDRIRAGEVLRRLSLNEIRKQLPFATQDMNLRLYAQEAEILNIKQQLARIMEEANTPQLVLYQNPKTLQLLVADPADIGLDSEFVPLAPMAISPVGEALERQKALTVDLAMAQDNLKALGKEARTLHQRLTRMLEYWRLDDSNADCTAANAEKMRNDCQMECEGDRSVDHIYQLTEGLMSYTSCYSPKIDLPLVEGIKNFYLPQIYLDSMGNQ